MESSDKKDKAWQVDVDDITNPKPKLGTEVEDIQLTDDAVKKEFDSLSTNQLSWDQIYKIIVDTRKFEIENFWKRTLFFWGTVAILLGSYFNVRDNPDFLIFIAYIGFFYNIIFSFSLRGSKYWQEHWELLAVKYETIAKIRLFKWQSNEIIRKQSKTVFPFLRPFRFSVSKLTMVLSDLTIFFWALLIFKDISNLTYQNKLHFDFPNGNSFHLFSFAVVTLPLVCIIYLSILIYKNYIKYK